MNKLAASLAAGLIVLLSWCPAFAQEDSIATVLEQLHAEIILILDSVTTLDSALQLLSQVLSMSLYDSLSMESGAHVQQIMNLVEGAEGEHSDFALSPELHDLVDSGQIAKSDFSIPGFSSYMDGRLLVIRGGIMGVVEEMGALLENIETLLALNAEQLLPLFESAFSYRGGDTSAPTEERMVIIESTMEVMRFMLRRVEILSQLTHDAATASLSPESDDDAIVSLHALSAYVMSLRGCNRQPGDTFPGLETALGGFFAYLWSMFEGLSEAHTAATASGL